MTISLFLLRARHMKAAHNIIIKMIGSHPCDYIGCDFVAETNMSLIRHKCEHSGENPNACKRTGCGFVGKTSKDLYNHRRKAHYKRTKHLSCDLCDKKFHCLSQLKVHNYSHSKEFPLKCELCGKGVVYKFQLDQHKLLVHSGIKGFECSYADCHANFSSYHQRFALNLI